MKNENEDKWWPVELAASVFHFILLGLSVFLFISAMLSSKIGLNDLDAIKILLSAVLFATWSIYLRVCK